jgi:hypothetical protein
MIWAVLIAVGVVTVLYACVVMGSNDDDRHGRD